MFKYVASVQASNSSETYFIRGGSLGLNIDLSFSLFTLFLRERTNASTGV